MLWKCDQFPRRPVMGLNLASPRPVLSTLVSGAWMY